MNTLMKKLLVAASAGLLIAGVAGCDRNNPDTTVGQKVDKAIDTTNQKMADAGKAIENKTTQAGQAIDDASITVAVKAEYAKDKEVDALKINVDTKDGIVTLNGSAPSEAGRLKAESLAMGVKGVSKVNNNLTVKTG
jgi:hyperosmotically inducible periplasmic protein